MLIKIKKDNMKKAVKGGFLNATEVADYLVRKDIPFRDAHEIVGQIVIYCEDNNKAISYFLFKYRYTHYRQLFSSTFG